MDDNSGDFQSVLTYTVSKIGHPGLSLKPEQVAAIQAVYCGKDILYGFQLDLENPALCYEALPFVYDCKLCRIDADSHKSLVLVISPLVALMVDQVKSLRKRNIPCRAAIISGGAGGVDEQLLATEDNLAKCSLLYGAPEVVLTSKWRDTLEQKSLYTRVTVAVVIDECHCVSTWSVCVSV